MAKKRKPAKGSALGPQEQPQPPLQVATSRKRKLTIDTLDSVPSKKIGVPPVIRPSGSDSDTVSPAPEGSFSTFVYEPLPRTADSIRLLTLHPLLDGDSPNIVRCDLTPVTFREKPDYEALSYTWGKSETRCSIWLNGTLVRVRENLFWALQNLRQDQPRTLWVDALCIDQGSNSEKKYQVGIMDYIYTRAQTVLLWLGIVPQGITDDMWSGGSNWSAALRDWVCRNPYWSRLWVIQEVGLAQKLVVCTNLGTRPWNKLVDRVCSPKGSLDASLIEKLEAKRRGRHGSSNALVTLLMDFQYAECAEVRDKVFGLLGLAHDCQDGSIIVDYNVDIFELYVEVIGFFCRKRLMPSGATNELDISMRLMQFSQQMHKSLQKPTILQSLSPSSSSLIVRAKAAVVSEIIHLGPTYDEMISSSAANKKWKNAFNEHYRDLLENEKMREANEAYSAKLLAMTDQDISRIRGIFPRYMYSRAEYCNPWDVAGKTFDRDSDYYKLTRLAESEQDRIEIENDMQEVDQCRMFLGGQEYMGLAPPQAQKGDKICLFWEVDVAALLRKELNSHWYRVVGIPNISTGFMANGMPRYRKRAVATPGTDAMLIHMDIRTLATLST
ncbi:heterokaryon incompatibility protein-domain-containing protein [Cadophora sp. MPI-SDFR-AT-0126]|nr:heterokaryon incompatibility protein-domain-containing protein [Leotiomycetes sp. MPI-SDFR-AT-0126]